MKCCIMLNPKFCLCLMHILDMVIFEFVAYLHLNSKEKIKGTGKEARNPLPLAFRPSRVLRLPLFSLPSGPSLLAPMAEPPRLFQLKCSTIAQEATLHSIHNKLLACEIKFD
jgi:hypothetical protein